MTETAKLSAEIAQKEADLESLQKELANAVNDPQKRSDTDVKMRAIENVLAGLRTKEMMNMMAANKASTDAAIEQVSGKLIAESTRLEAKIDENQSQNNLKFADIEKRLGKIVASHEETKSDLSDLTNEVRKVSVVVFGITEENPVEEVRDMVPEKWRSAVNSAFYLGRPPRGGNSVPCSVRMATPADRDRFFTYVRSEKFRKANPDIFVVPSTSKRTRVGNSRFNAALDAFKLQFPECNVARSYVRVADQKFDGSAFAAESFKVGDETFDVSTACSDNKDYEPFASMILNGAGDCIFGFRKKKGSRPKRTQNKADGVDAVMDEVEEDDELADSEGRRQQRGVYNTAGGFTITNGSATARSSARNNVQGLNV